MSCGYLTPNEGKIWGTVTRTASSDITWGETVLTISDFLPQTYFHALNAISTTGIIVQAFTLVPTDSTYKATIKLYSPDFAKIEIGKNYHIWGLFHINT